MAGLSLELGAVSEKNPNGKNTIIPAAINIRGI